MATTIIAVSRPVIVLVPGAWHTVEHYKPLIERLELKGYEVKGQNNMSLGSKAPDDQTVEADVAAIRDQVLLPLLGAGKDVVIVMHSYGGCPGAAAAKELSKPERSKQGQQGGIIGLAFICAFVANEGESLLSKAPGKTWEPWWNLLGNGQIEPLGPKEVFYADVPDSIAQQAIETLRPQSRVSFTSASPPPAWPEAVYNGRRSYLQCSEDQAIPFIGQQMMVQHSGVEWNVAQMQSGHSPFLSRPQETADWVEQQVEIFKTFSI